MRALQRKRGSGLGDVFDLDFEAGGVLREPAQGGVCRRPAVGVLGEARDRAVVNDVAALVAPRRVDDLADGDLAHDAVNQARSMRAADAVLEEWRDVYQGRGVADGVVLVLVVGLVRANGVVARPVAVAQALAERERSLVEGCSDWHAADSACGGELDCCKNGFSSQTRMRLKDLLDSFSCSQLL